MTVLFVGTGFRVQVQGKGFRVQGSGLRVKGSGLVRGSGFNLALTVLDREFRVVDWWD